MFVFNCTKAAANFLSPRKSKDTKPLIQAVPEFSIDEVGTPKAPISQWLVMHSNELGKDILYVCHVQHRFTMVFTDVKKGNWREFMLCFWERFFNHLCFLVDDMPFNLKSTPKDWLSNIQTAHRKNGELILFCQRYNPSVNASINRFRSRFSTALYEIGCLPNNDEAGEFEADANAQLHYSGSKENMFFPAHELFCDCLEAYMGASKKDLPDFKSLSLDYFDQYFNAQFETPDLDHDMMLELVESLRAKCEEDKNTKAKTGKAAKKLTPKNVLELKKKN